VHVTTVLVTHDQEEAMEIASRIVVMNHGRIEQVGTPAELYEHPATEFVMSFVGKVNRIGDAYIRPHEVAISLIPEAHPATARVDRLISLGFEHRVQLALDSGEAVVAQLTAPEVNRLSLHRGQTVSLDLSRRRRFGDPSRDSRSSVA
jgi:sulfate/thiosulfate transport system ATP-binding protein